MISFAHMLEVEACSSRHVHLTSKGAGPGGQGHLRVGPTTVSDPAFLVTRAMEDFVTWVDTSKIRRKVEKYNDRLDDYDLLYS